MRRNLAHFLYVYDGNKDSLNGLINLILGKSPMAKDDSKESLFYSSKVKQISSEDKDLEISECILTHIFCRSPVGKENKCPVSSFGRRTAKIFRNPSCPDDQRDDLLYHRTNLN
mmetsp:Transcript_1466/g.3064  ORF Transcript_1466/g.3064 Transcript_1466/m.3064 type:complete len:114 (+) Transcript_1466:3137-3478(+)